MKKMRFPALCLMSCLSMLLSSCSGPGPTASNGATDAPATVTTLDIKRYLGTWYEIAAYPQRFQRGCVATRAEYSLRKDGDLRVLNRCRQNTLDGEWKEVEGRARVVAPGKLKVSFFWPFEGDYWVLALDPDYRWALIGGPGRDYLWILSRSPKMDDGTYAKIAAEAVKRGYALAPLKRTLQGDEQASPDTSGRPR